MVHSHLYVTKMIDKTHRQVAFAVAEILLRRLLVCIIHEDSASRVNITNGRSIARDVTKYLSLLSNRQFVIFRYKLIRH